MYELKIYMHFYSRINKRDAPLNVSFGALQNIVEDVWTAIWKENCNIKETEAAAAGWGPLEAENVPGKEWNINRLRLHWMGQRAFAFPQP